MSEKSDGDKQSSKPLPFTELTRYFATLESLLVNTETTDESGTTMALEQACEHVRANAQNAHNGGKKIIFLGNGGSSAIASHLAIDYSKNGQLRALAFNDAAALTCLGNDFGYELVFAKQIEFHAQPGDLIIAISSSGRSPNILNAVRAGRDRECVVVTYSGFSPTNELRSMGDVNFYIRSGEYGFVEVAHLALCHAVLDFHTGWTDAR